MSEHISYQGNPATRGTASMQFFEAASGTPPGGGKATPRPADRPREVPPPAGSAPAAVQVFTCEGPSEAEGAQATPRPAGRERAVPDRSPPAVPPASELGQRP